MSSSKQCPIAGPPVRLTRMAWLVLVICCLIAPAWGLASTLTATFTDFTSNNARKNMALYKSGETVNIQFSATGVTVNQTLTVTIKDAKETTVFGPQTYTVNTSPNWSTSITGYNGALGFYRVYASLNDGTQIAYLGSRPPGFITYCVLPDPTTRLATLPDTQTFFGIQGGFNLASPTNNAIGTDALALMGIRWTMGGWAWKNLSPDYANKYSGYGDAETPGLVCTAATNGAGGAWTVHEMPNLTKDGRPYGGSPDVYKTGTFAYNTGALKDEPPDPYRTEWKTFCGNVASAFPQVDNYRSRPMYEITWEPIPPWGYGGTVADLVAMYQLANQGIKGSDPNAWVVGPCMGLGQDVWNNFDGGLGSYIDAFSAHPYMYSDSGDWFGAQMEPEKVGQPAIMHDARRRIRGYMSRDIPMIGTEQGYPTYDCEYNTTTGALTYHGTIWSNELEMARRIVRSNLLVLGEGWQTNVAFFWGDYPQKIVGSQYFWDYGFFYNLDIGTYIGDPVNNPTKWSGSYGGWGPNKIQPKPVVSAYAAMTWLLEGRYSVCDINWLSATTRGYAFQSFSNSSDVILALWDFSGTAQNYDIPTGVSSVDVYDMWGNKTTMSCTLVDGVYTLTSTQLTKDVKYLKGVAASIWGSIRPNAVISAGKPVTASSQDASYPKANAVDGDNVAPLSRWLSAADAGKPEHWIYVDLGANRTVNEVRFWTGHWAQFLWGSSYTDALSAYTIQYSTNGTSWTNCHTPRTGNTKAVVCEAFSPVTARYIRLDVPAGTIEQVQLYELQVLTNNAVPTVSLTSPTQGQSFTAPATVTLNATASDSDGISKVEFYQGGFKLGEDTSSPYSYSWSNVPKGSYVVWARAIDNVGASKCSTPASITVNPGGSGTITVTAPNDAYVNVGTGDWYNVTWTSSGTVGNVNIDLTVDGGVTWTSLAANTPNDGSQGVYMPSPPGDHCRVRIQEPDGSPSDQSDAEFVLKNITVVSPNGGETLTAGSTVPVTWTSFGNVGNVSIEISTNGGGAWTTLVASTANDGSENITVPGTPTTYGRIRIRGPYGTPSDTSNANFTIQSAPAGTITVTAPNDANVNVGVGDWYNVTWTTTGTVGNVNIDLTVDGGTTWTSLASDTPNDGSEGVYMPGPAGDHCRVRVQEVDGSPSDQSDADFVLKALTVTSPNGGEVLTVGDGIVVTWTSYGNVGNVDIEISTNGGGTWTPLVTGTANDGYENITVPSTPTTYGRIRVKGPFGSPYDTSDANFTIQTGASGTITVTAPNDQYVNVGTGDWYNVTWTTTGTVGNVNIDLTADGGQTWTNLATNTPNDGAQGVYMPLPYGDKCRVRIREADGSPSDVSNANFVLKNITVTAPNGGETWAQGSVRTVTWTSFGSVGNVDIQISTNGGGTWTNLVTGTANDGSENITVPNTPTSQARIRVRGPYGSPYDVSNANFTIQ